MVLLCVTRFVKNIHIHDAYKTGLYCYCVTPQDWYVPGWIVRRSRVSILSQAGTLYITVYRYLNPRWNCCVICHSFIFHTDINIRQVAGIQLGRDRSVSTQDGKHRLFWCYASNHANAITAKRSTLTWRRFFSMTEDSITWSGKCQTSQNLCIHFVLGCGRGGVVHVDGLVKDWYLHY